MSLPPLVSDPEVCAVSSEETIPHFWVNAYDRDGDRWIRVCDLCGRRQP